MAVPNSEIILELVHNHANLHKDKHLRVWALGWIWPPSLITVVAQ